MWDSHLSRYSAIDAYTLEELTRRYQMSRARERIELIKSLYAAGQMPPYELARLAAQDEHSDVRAWMARHALYLDYSEPVDDTDANSAHDPSRDLIKVLRQDEDPFVRASLYENPIVFENYGDQQWLDTFGKASHLERLAVVRNPRAHSVHKLLEALFDPNNDTFELAAAQREELVSAMLVSRQALTEHDRNTVPAMPDPWDARLFSKLWSLINKWPEESKIRRNIYLYIGTTIRTKAGIYRHCRQPTFRAELLRHADPQDTDTLELGMRDRDNRCRYLAHSKARNLSNTRFDTILDGSDLYALLGLAENASLSIDQLEEVKNRLFSIGAHEQARWATETIERKKQTQAPENHEELFESALYAEHFLHEKINALGHLLLSIRREVDYIEDVIEGNDKLAR